MFKNNPELMKNVKLEFNLTRIVILSLLLLMLSWIGWKTGELPAWEKVYTQEQYTGKTLFNWLSAFGFFVSIVWGSYLVVNSFVEEVKLKTWDFVRLSSLPPFKIVLGKIFGAPSVVWLITLLLGIPLIIFAGANALPEAGGVRPQNITLFSLTICLLSWIVFSYSFGLFMSVSGYKKFDRNGSFSATALIFISGLFIGGSIQSAFESFHKKIYISNNNKIMTIDPYTTINPSSIDWYGMKLYSIDMLALLLSFCAFWAFIGAWRVLRESLQYRDMPWVWIIFIASSSLFLNGFKPGPLPLYEPILISLITLILTCVKEAGDMIKYKSLLHKIRQKSYAEAFRDMPLWIISFITLCIFSILFNEQVKHYASAMNVFAPELKPGLFLLSLIIIATRDIIVCHAIFWMPNIRRPLLGFAVYAAVIYVLFPALLATIDDDYIKPFFPDPTIDHMSAYWIIHGAVILTALYFARKFWQSSLDRKARV